MQWDGEWGLQSVHYTLSLTIFPPQGEDYSYSSPCSSMGPFPGREISMNFSTVDPSHMSISPFHGVQSFQNRLLCLAGSQGITCSSVSFSLSPWVHRWAAACSSVGFPQCHSLICASTCSSTEPWMGCRCISGSPVGLHGLQGHSCFTMICTTGCRETSAPVPGAPPPPPSLTLVSAELFLSIFPLFSSSVTCHGLGMVLLDLVLPLRLSKSPCCWVAPPALPLGVAREENWRHRRQRWQVKMRTVYWEQPWDKKRNSNSNNIDNKSVY